MKTKQFFYAILFFIGFSATAQQAPFMVCNPDGTTCSPYTTLTLAYNAAAAGDYIYMPAGDFTLDVYIAKQVHLVGAGFDVNASLATGITRVSGNIYFSSIAANGSSFEGFYLVGNFHTFGVNMSNLTFNNLNFNLMEFYYYGNSFSNCVVNNCVVRSYLNFGHVESNMGENNIVMNSFVKSFHTMNHSTIKNCVISKYDVTTWCFNNIKNTVIKNCIIGGEGLQNLASNYSNNVTFLNNLTTANSGQLANGKSSCTEFNNSFGSLATDTFISATNYTFDPNLDYHIKTTSPAHNGGDNATDMGVYGGSSPWKVGSIPNYPHISSKTISPTTDGSGNLPVHIIVTTQN
jgi:hypothetical protein